MLRVKVSVSGLDLLRQAKPTIKGRFIHSEVPNGLRYAAQNMLLPKIKSTVPIGKTGRLRKSYKLRSLSKRGGESFSVRVRSTYPAYHAHLNEDGAYNVWAGRFIPGTKAVDRAFRSKAYIINEYLERRYLNWILRNIW